MKFIIAFILILCTSWSNKPGSQPENSNGFDKSMNPKMTQEKKNQKIENTIKNNEIESIQFCYEIEADPIEFRQTHSEIPIEEIQNNVFKGQYEYNSYYYINLNTYSEIRIVEDADKNYYSEILNFKDMSLTVGGCRYDFKKGLNHHEDCEKFWPFEDSHLAYLSAFSRFNEFLRSYNKEYFDNTVKYFMIDTSSQTKEYDEIFTQEVMEECLRALTEYIDHNYNLDPSILNDEFSESLISEYIQNVNR